MPLNEARFVTVSGIAVPTAGAAALEEAMQNRLGLVESEPGFGGLQVWRPLRSGTVSIGCGSSPSIWVWRSRR